jgi:predicted ester cyclase
MLEENKALSRRYRGLRSGDTHIVDELLAPDFVFYDPSSKTGEVRAEDMKASIEWIHSAFPDAQVTIEDQVAEGDKVVSRYKLSGTHQGEIMGAAPTGKLVRHTGHRPTASREARSWRAGPTGTLSACSKRSVSSPRRGSALAG